MYLFLVLPSPLQRFFSVCEIEVEAGPSIFFYFSFKDFKLRIKKLRHKTAIKLTFLWETQRKWTMAF